MIDAIKLEDTAVLRDARLKNLGRINVICGKNSSGKSTILRKLAQTWQANLGFKLGEKDVQAFKNAWKSKAYSQNFALKKGTRQWNLKELFDAFVNIGDVFAEIFTGQDYYFSNEVELFVKQFIKTAIEIHERPQRLNPGYQLAIDFISDEANRHTVEKLTATVFSKPFEAVNRLTHIRPFFVSPKRRANISTSIIANPTVGSEGEGLVEKLFALKSSLPGSPERKFYEIIFQHFLEVSENFKFDVVFESNKEEVRLELFFSSQSQENWISAGEAGLGLQDLLVMIYFALEPEYELLIIEEPENHLHPDMQRRFLQFLKENTPSNKQFILSTHSSIFLDVRYVNRILFSSFDDGTINISDATSRAKILQNLGYSVNDNLVSDLIVLVEGSGDKSFLEEFFIKLGFDTKFNIKIWILGGDEMVNQDLSAFKQDYKIIALVDKDTMSEKNREVFEKHCAEYDIVFHKLNRYSIESYFSSRALNAIFNKYNLNIPEIDGVDNGALVYLIKNQPLWKKLSNNPERQNELKTKIKRKVRDIAREMTESEIDGTDLREFFDKLTVLLETP